MDSNQTTSGLVLWTICTQFICITLVYVASESSLRLTSFEILEKIRQIDVQDHRWGRGAPGTPTFTLKVRFSSTAKSCSISQHAFKSVQMQEQRTAGLRAHLDHVNQTRQSRLLWNISSAAETDRERSKSKYPLNTELNPYGNKTPIVMRIRPFQGLTTGLRTCKEVPSPIAAREERTADWVTHWESRTPMEHPSESGLKPETWVTLSASNWPGMSTLI